MPRTKLLSAFLAKTILLQSVFCLFEAQASGERGQGEGWREIYNLIPSESAGYERIRIFSKKVIDLVGSGQLVTSEDYYRAGHLASYGYGEFNSNLVAYECFITAIAKGSRGARRMLPSSWDRLMLSVSRPIRINSFPQGDHLHNDELFQLELAPRVVLDVWLRTSEALIRASSSEDNLELIRIEAEDQAVRGQNWSELDRPALMAIREGDRMRNLRVRELVLDGQVVTRADFARAALVLQHGRHFSSFRLAHELSICALLLGDDGFGRWLVAATFDRMLLSIGHKQRFGSQINSDGTIEDLDSYGICDAQRIAFGTMPARE